MFHVNTAQGYANSFREWVKLIRLYGTGTRFSTNLNVPAVEVVREQVDHCEVADLVEAKHELDVPVRERIVFPGNPAVTCEHRRNIEPCTRYVH